MKIINEGTGGYGVKWWHGKEITCDICERVGELEPGDINMDEFRESDFQVSLRCKCGTIIYRRRKYDIEASFFKHVFTE